MESRLKPMLEIDQLNYRVTIRMTMQQRRKLEELAAREGDRTMTHFVYRAIQHYMEYIDYYHILRDAARDLDIPEAELATATAELMVSMYKDPQKVRAVPVTEQREARADA